MNSSPPEKKGFGIVFGARNKSEFFLSISRIVTPCGKYLFLIHLLTVSSAYSKHSMTVFMSELQLATLGGRIPSTVPTTSGIQSYPLSRSSAPCPESSHLLQPWVPSVTPTSQANLFHLRQHVTLSFAPRLSPWEFPPHRGGPGPPTPA